LVHEVYLTNPKILIDPDPLSLIYLSKRLSYREEEYTRLLNSIKNRINALIFGPIGPGKTALVKIVMRELNRDIFYVDCLLCSTEYSIFEGGFALQSVHGLPKQLRVAKGAEKSCK